MKTNVIMISNDRELFGVKIRQQTKTGMLNLSDLQEAYTHARITNGWSDKDISNIINGKENTERIFYLLEKQGVSITPSFHGFIEEVKKQGITKVLKSCGVYLTTGARHTKTTWCNPYIWVLVAMELNPMLYAETVIWLTDKLIINRIEAGNLYKGLTKSISKFNNVDYVKLAKALNFVVFNRHENGIRNTATQSELKELENLERNISFIIDRGFVNTFEDVLEELRKEWNIKYSSKVS